MLSSGEGYADDLNLRTHAIAGNRFVLEGGHYDFEQIFAKILADIRSAIASE